MLMQPIVAVPSFICADAFSKFLPFCTGFAAGCMIWMVIAEVLPDAFKVIYLYIFKPKLL
jgi:zinc transporter ZupT